MTITLLPLAVNELACLNGFKPLETQQIDKLCKPTLKPHSVPHNNCYDKRSQTILLTATWCECNTVLKPKSWNWKMAGENMDKRQLKTDS